MIFYLYILRPRHIRIPKDTKTQRTIDRFEDFLVEYPVREISVAVVEGCIFIFVFFVL